MKFLAVLTGILATASAFVSTPIPQVKHRRTSQIVVVCLLVMPALCVFACALNMYLYACMYLSSSTACVCPSASHPSASSPYAMLRHTSLTPLSPPPFHPSKVPSAPLPSGRRSSALRMSASDMIGIDVETGGLFDPLGFSKDEQSLYRYRAVELKHGRGKCRGSERKRERAH